MKLDGSEDFKTFDIDAKMAGHYLRVSNPNLSMKNPLITLAALSISTCAAFSQSFDANVDGNVTREEYVKVWEGQFEHLDGDADGKLSKSEWRSGQAFIDSDKNVDGFVDKDEWMAARLSEFDSKDANHDGVLDATELKAR